MQHIPRADGSFEYVNVHAKGKDRPSAQKLDDYNINMGALKIGEGYTVAA